MTTVVWKSNKDPENSHSGNKKRTVIETFSWQMRTQSHAWSPPTDLIETATAYVVRIEVAGMRQQDFEVTFQDGYVVVRGIRVDSPERRAFHQMEIRFGEFSTAVSIPGPVNVDKIEADYEDGFLVIVLPKAASNLINIS